MTADHCIQVAAIIVGSITPFAVAIWGPTLSSRITQPKQKLETAKPRNIAWRTRIRLAWFICGLNILVSIVSLHLEMRSVQVVTTHQILWIAIDVAAIGFSLAISFAIWLLDLIRDMNAIDGEIIRVLLGLARSTNSDSDDSSQT